MKRITNNSLDLGNFPTLLKKVLVFSLFSIFLYACSNSTMPTGVEDSGGSGSTVAGSGGTTGGGAGGTTGGGAGGTTGGGAGGTTGGGAGGTTGGGAGSGSTTTVLTPKFTGASLAADNSYMDVFFNTGVYNKSGSAVTTSDFNVSASSGISVSNITKQNSVALQGGEDVIRFHLNGGSSAAGTETIDVKPKANNSVFSTTTGKGVMAISQNVNATLNDKKAPNSATIKLDPASDSGSDSSDRITNKSQVLVTGTAEANAKVVLTYIYNNQTTALSSVSVSSNGTWQENVNLPNDGFSYVVATVEDTAGNTSNSNALLITKDSKAAKPTTVSQIATQNKYVDVDFDKNISGSNNSVTAVDKNDFEIVDEKNLTAGSISIDQTKKVGGGSLTGGENKIRFQLNAPANVATNNQTFKIAAKANSVFDKAGNETATADKTPAIVLQKTVMTTAPTIDLANADDSGTSNTDNYTNVQKPTFTGTADKNATIEIYDSANPNTILATATAGSTGNWQATPSTNLPDNVYNLIAKASDSNGNSSLSSALSVTIDTTAPSGYAVGTLGSKNYISSNNQGNFDFEISNAEVGSGYSYTIANSANLTSPNNVTGGATVTGVGASTSLTVPSLDLTNLNEGTIVIAVSLTDKAGNQGDLVTRNITKDITSPTIVYTDNIAANNAYVDLTFGEKVYGGTAAALAPLDKDDFIITDTTNFPIGLTLVIDSLKKTTGANLTGGETAIRVYFQNPQVTVTNATFKIAVANNSVFDAAGNASLATVTSSAITLLKNTITKPTIDLLDTDDSGDSNKDNITNKTKPTLEGTAEANATVKIYDGTNTSPIATTSADSSGNYSVTLSTLAEGTYLLTAKATDSFGNSASSTTLTVTIDTTAPTGYVLAANSYVNAGNQNNFSFNFNKVEVGTKYFYTISESSTPTNKVSGPANGTDVTAANITVPSINVTSLAEGQLTITAYAKDVAGNQGTSKTKTITKDTVAPKITSTGTIAANNVYVDLTFSEGVYGGTSPLAALEASDFVITDKTNFPNSASNTLSVAIDSLEKATASSTALVGGETVIRVKLTVTGNVTTANSSTFKIAVENNSVFDAAANASPATVTSSAITLLKNTTATPTIDLVDADDSGDSKKDNITNKTKPTLEGTAEANATVKIYDGTNTSPIATTSADNSGNYSVTLATLTEGTHLLKAEASDNFGNSASSTTLTVTIDTTAPTGYVLAADDYVNANNQNNFSFNFNKVEVGTKYFYTISESSTPTNKVSGPANGTDVTVANITVPSINVSSLAEGQLTITAYATDVAGNQGSNETFNTTKDTVAPKITSTGTIAANNVYVDLTFSEGVYGGLATALTKLEASDFIITDETNFPTANTLSVAIASLEKATASSTALVGGETVIRVKLTITGNVTTANSSTFKIAVKSNSVFDKAANASPATGANVVKSNEITLLQNTIAKPTIDLATVSDSGELDNDDITNKNKPTLEGTAEVNATVKIYASTNTNTNAIATATADANGKWTTTLTTALNNGVHSLTAKASNSTSSATSDPLSITIDTTAPTGYVLAANNYVNANNETTFSFNFNNVEVGTKYFYTISDSSTPAQKVSGPTTGTNVTGTNTANINVSPVDVSSLADGQLTITAYAVDVAGNQGGNATFNTTKDITSPTIVGTSVIAPANAYVDLTFSEGVYGGLATALTKLDKNDFIITDKTNFPNSASNTLSVAIASLEKATTPSTALVGGETVIRVKLTITGNVTTANSSTFKIAVSNNSVFDAATNASPATVTSSAITLLKNFTEKPTIDLATASDSGELDNDNITNQNKPILEGTAEVNATVEIYDGVNTSPIATVSVGANGKWQANLTTLTAVLNDSVHSLTAKAIDSFSNSNTSAALDVTIDTTAPTGYSLAANNYVNANNQNNFSFNFNSVEVGTKYFYTISDSSSPAKKVSGPTTGTNVTGTNTANITVSPVDVSSLADGQLTITAYATDVAGNQGDSVTFNTTKDTAIPTIVSAETMDIDKNGKLDHYKLTFSDKVKDSSFPNAGGTTTDWIVQNYSNVKIDSSPTGIVNTTDDETIYIAFDEISGTCDATSQVGCDTGVKPELTTTATPALTDLAGNQIAQITTGTNSFTEADRAAPKFVGAKADSHETVKVVFSEDVQATTAECSTVTACSAIYNIIETGGTTVISVSKAVMNPTSGNNSNSVVLTTSAQTYNTNYTVSAVLDSSTPKQGKIQDASNNHTIDGVHSTTFAGGRTALKLLSAKATKTNKVKLVFNQKVDTATVAVATNYTIPGLTITAATVDPSDTSGATIILTTTNHTSDTPNGYTVTVTDGVVEAANGGLTCKNPNNTATFTGDLAPEIVSVSSINSTTIYVVFSEPMDVTSGSSASSVLDINNYSISPTLAVSSPVNVKEGRIIRLTTAGQTTDQLYTLTAAATITDKTGNQLAVNSGNFLGNEAIKMISAKEIVIDTTKSFKVFKVVFSKPFMASTVKTLTNWKFPFAAAVTGGLTVCMDTDDNACPADYTNSDTEIFFKINKTNLPEAGVHAIVGTTNITDSGGNALASLPYNRAYLDWGDIPVSLEKPAFADPFADDDKTLAGQVVKYNNKLLIGPNLVSSTNDTSFLLQTETNLTSSKPMVLDMDDTKNGNQPFYDLSYTCTISDRKSNQTGIYWNRVDVKTKQTCKTHRIDTFFTAKFNSKDYLFLLGYNSRSPGNSGGGEYQSVWYTADKTSPMQFKLLKDISHRFGTTYRAMATVQYNGWVYQVQQSAYTGVGSWSSVPVVSPRVSRYQIDTSGEASLYTPEEWIIDLLSNKYSNSDLGWNYINRIGTSGNQVNGQKYSSTEWYMISIDSMAEYQNKLYIANGGSCDANDLSNRSRSAKYDGGIMRTVNTSTVLTQCKSTSDCTGQWADITPTANEWNMFMSKALPKEAYSGKDWDYLLPENTIAPSIKAIPKMVEFKGDLYVIRNACSDVTVQTLNNGTHDTCASGSERPQLWRLQNGTTWTLIADANNTTRMSGATWNGGDSTNLASYTARNNYITLLEVVGDRLYVGFDNATDGANVWRSKSGVTGAITAESDFEAVCQTDNACATVDKQFGWYTDTGKKITKIYSSLSAKDAGKDYLIFTANRMDNSSEKQLQIFRTGND